MKRGRGREGGRERGGRGRKGEGGEGEGGRKRERERERELASVCHYVRNLAAVNQITGKVHLNYSDHKQC